MRMKKAMEDFIVFFCYGIFRLSCLGQKFLACGIRCRIDYLSNFQQEFCRSTPLNLNLILKMYSVIKSPEKTGIQPFSKVDVFRTKQENRGIPYTNQPLSIFVFG